MVSELYEAYEKNGKVTYEEMAKYNRLLKMESKVKDIIKDMASRNAKTLFADMSLLYSEVYGRLGYAIEKKTGRRLNYGAQKRAKIRALIDAPLTGLKLTERLTNNRNAVYTNIKAEITRGFINGDSYGAVAKKLSETLDGDIEKAKRIVRTETHRAVTTAEQSSVDHAKSKGIRMKKTWMTSKDERVRSSHRHMDGITVDSDKPFDLGGGVTCMVPGQTGVASEDINCRCLVKYEIVGFDGDDDDGETYEEWAKQRELPVSENLKETGRGMMDYEEEAALNRYLSFESYSLNEKLRNGTSLSENENEFVKKLDSALDKMPKYNGTVYRSISSRSISDIDEFWNVHKKGYFVRYPAYTSTSTEMYDETMDIQYVITGKTGRDIRIYNENEKEILFKRNSRFYITDVIENTIYMEED